MQGKFPQMIETDLTLFASLINTMEPHGRPITTVQDLDNLLEPWSFSGRRTHDETEVIEVCAVRDTLSRLWDAERDDAASIANAILGTALAVPQLVRHDDYDWHVHGVASHAPFAKRLTVEAAMAFVDLIRIDETSRCKRCGAHDCNFAFFDMSRNRSRRFCSTTCQSRTNVAAFRSRNAT